MKLQRIITPNRGNYSIVGNSICRNPEISSRAVGIYFRVMCLPNDWDFTIRGLVSITKEGETAIRQAIRELVKHGYCQISRVRHKGLIVGVEYKFFDEPQSDFPHVENPRVENPRVENQGQLNTYRIKDLINKSVDVVDNSASQKIENSFDCEEPSTLTEFELGAAADAPLIQSELKILKQSGFDLEKFKTEWIAEHANKTVFKSYQHASNVFRKRMIEIAATAKRVGKSGKIHAPPQAATAKPNYKGAKRYAPGSEILYDS